MNLSIKKQKKRQKLHKLFFNFLNSYLLKNLNFKKQIKKKLIAKRNVKISKIFNSNDAYVSQGRVLVRVPLNVYKIGFTFGEFAATKKPFNFRPKKLKQKR